MENLNRATTMDIDVGQFERLVNKLSKQVSQIIEVGTFKGTGSTPMLAQTGVPVVTLEGRTPVWEIAKENLEKFKNVECINGLSLKKGDMATFIIYDQFIKEVLLNRKDIIVDKAGLMHSPLGAPRNVEEGFQNTQHFYFQEMNGCENEDLLWDYINNYKKQLIFLDGGGGVGYLEFLKVMQLSQDKLRTKFLILDDIGHIKHYRSKLYLLNAGYVFRESKQKRWGWTDFTKSKKKFMSNDLKYIKLDDRIDITWLSTNLSI